MPVKRNTLDLYVNLGRSQRHKARLKNKTKQFSSFININSITSCEILKAHTKIYIPTEVSKMMKIFYISTVQYGNRSHSPHVATCALGIRLVRTGSASGSKMTVPESYQAALRVFLGASQQQLLPVPPAPLPGPTMGLVKSPDGKGINSPATTPSHTACPQCNCCADQVQ